MRRAAADKNPRNSRAVLDAESYRARERPAARVTLAGDAAPRSVPPATSRPHRHAAIAKLAATVARPFRAPNDPRNTKRSRPRGVRPRYRTERIEINPIRIDHDLFSGYVYFGQVRFVKELAPTMPGAFHEVDQYKCHSRGSAATFIRKENSFQEREALVAVPERRPPQLLAPHSS